MSPWCHHRQQLPRLPSAGGAPEGGLSRQELSGKWLAPCTWRKVGACFCLLAHEETSLAKFTLDCPGISAVC